MLHIAESSAENNKIKGTPLKTRCMIVLTEGYTFKKHFDGTKGVFIIANCLPHVAIGQLTLSRDADIGDDFNFSDLHGWSLPHLLKVRNTPSSQPTSQALFALDIFDVYRPEGSAALKAELRRVFRTPVLLLRKYTGGKPARRGKHTSCVIYRARS